MKCDQYFPIENEVVTNEFSITLLEETNEFPTLIKREFEIKHEKIHVFFITNPLLGLTMIFLTLSCNNLMNRT